MSRRGTLARLRDELNTLATFDRLHDLATVHDASETRAYELRQIRRSQVTAEVEMLRTSRHNRVMNHIRVSSGFILLCAAGYVSLHYLFK
ncbi:MAG TPA: hypothetical protein VMS18_30530 [Candidatus Binatia bacterium]|nr:hypothetical protein [Candidatus Binatia bacterium]